LGLAWGSSEPDPKGLGFGDGDDIVGVVAGAGVGVGAVGSQLTPGFITKFNVSPSLMVYSFRSFPSARALPLRRRRCASAGGAEGKEASLAFIDDTVSVGWTLSVKLAGGFRDLNTSEMEAVSRRN